MRLKFSCILSHNIPLYFFSIHSIFYRFLQLSILSIIFLFSACFSEYSNTVNLSGKWNFTLQITFGENTTAFATLNLENPYSVSIQGSGHYIGTDGLGELLSIDGVVSGWIDDKKLNFYFVEDEKGDFSIQFIGNLNEGAINGTFNAFNRDKTWFHGVFNAVPDFEKGFFQNNVVPDKITSIVNPSRRNNYFKKDAKKVSGNYVSSKPKKKETESFDNISVLEDFEKIDDISGGQQSTFSHDDKFSLKLSLNDNVCKLDMNKHCQDWQSFTKIEFWTWLESDSMDSKGSFSRDFSPFDEKKTSSNDALNFFDLKLKITTQLPSGIEKTFLWQNRLIDYQSWVRHVIYLSDFQPPLLPKDLTDIIDFSIEVVAENEENNGNFADNKAFKKKFPAKNFDKPVAYVNNTFPDINSVFYLDQIRLTDERWFFLKLLSNGKLLSTTNNAEKIMSDYSSGRFGTLVIDLNDYFRKECYQNNFYSPEGVFTVDKNNCYADFKYPFPPYSCSNENTKFKTSADNYKINWCKWEEFGRDETMEKETKFLFWQWNDRLNRHRLLAELAAGIASQNEQDYTGCDFSMQDKSKWKQAFREMLAAWLYDFPLPVPDMQWGERCFTVFGDITTAIRTSQWSRMLDFLKHDTQSLPPWMFIDCLKILYLQGKISNESILTGWKPNNHTALSAYTLYSLGVRYPEFEGGGILWRDKGIEAVQGLAYPEGAAKEGSTHYHTLTLSFIDSFFELADKYDALYASSLKDELNVIVPEQLSMHLYLSGIAQPPLMDKNGNIELFAPAINDGVGTGVAITDYVDWLFDVYNNTSIPLNTSIFYPQVGQMVIKEVKNKGKIYLLFDTGPFGGGAHGHQDKLSFVLTAYGHPLLIDPGGWSGAGTDWERSSMHNTITVDDYGQVRKKADSYSTNYADNKWIENENEFKFEGVYNEGYGLTRNNQSLIIENVIHHRTIEYIKSQDPSIIITDKLTTLNFKPHFYRVYFHFHPQEAKLKDDLIIKNQLLKTKAGNLTIEALNQNGNWKTENRLISNTYQYGNVQTAATAFYTVKSARPETIIKFRLIL